MPALTVVIPTLGRPAQLERCLERLASQTAPKQSFEVVVVIDAAEAEPQGVEAIVAECPPARAVRAGRPGASAARNAGLSAARYPVVLFIDDDILAAPDLVREHLSWHERYPEPEVGVLGRVRWADQIKVTPFMRWLEGGIQFDYANISGTDAGWGRFYTANASVKRELVEAAGGFDEERLPFGYEDLDLALRMHELGLRLLYNRHAVAEHLHPMDLDFWRQRVRRIARAERAFSHLHPEVPPYFHRLFSTAAAAAPARGRGGRLTGFVPRWLPWLGPRVWTSAETRWRQALAGPFLEAWEEAAASDAGVRQPDLSERAAAPWSASPRGRKPGGS